MNDLSRVLARSLELIREHQADTGAYPASPTFPTYRYCWLRDGAFTADAVSRVGVPDSADRFFAWCDRVVTDRRGRIEQLLERHAASERIRPEEHLHTRYTLDGSEGDEPWWNFQLDGYGIWLWALDAHVARHDRPRGRHLDAVTAIVPYLAAFWAEHCYDWWEEHVDQRHTSTLAAIAAGLRAVAGWPELAATTRAAASDTSAAISERIEAEAIGDGHLTKWLGSRAVDASLAACIVPCGLYPVDHPVARATVARIEADLAPAGVYRYLDDVYYGGGQWVLLAGFLGWYHAEAGNGSRAEQLLAWMVDQADECGDLPEQVAVDLLHPHHFQGWVDRWGPSARPLLWSHAMLLTLAHALGHPAPDPTVVAAEPGPTTVDAEDPG